MPPCAGTTRDISIRFPPSGKSLAGEAVAKRQADGGTGVAGHPLTRRQLLAAIGGGAIALGGGAATTMPRALGVQIDASPPAVGPAPPVDSILPTIADKAAELQYDPARIFRYVADSVRYEPYSGILRGAKGTLWAQAGNSADKALLLAALLDEALVTYRFAVGPLDDATAKELAASANRPPADAEARLEQVLFATNARASAGGLSAQQRQEFESLPAQGRAMLDRSRSDVAFHAALVQHALTEHGVTLPAAGDGLPALERSQHVWLQVADGPAWIDHDPSLVGIATGKALARASQTVEQLPPELHHRLTFRVDAEVVTGGQPARTTLATQQALAADLAGVPVTILNARPESFKALGLTIGGLLEGTRQYLPYIVIGETALPGTLFGFHAGSGGNAALDGASGGLEGETTAEWLVIEVASPDGATATIERAIFDRVGYARRASKRPVDVASLPPVIMTADPATGSEDYLPARTMMALSIAGGGTPLAAFEAGQSMNDAITALGAAPLGWQVLRDIIAVDAHDAAGRQFVLDAPNIVAFVIEPAGAGEAATVRLSLDILHRSLAATGPGAGAVDARIAGGVLAAVAERMTVTGAGTAPALGGTPATGALPDLLPNVLDLFEEADRQRVPIVLVTSTAPVDLAANGHGAEAVARIEAAVAAGVLVVVPQRPVVVGGVPYSGWWQIDPATGATIDVFQNGRGPEMTEEAVVDEVEVQNGEVWRRLGCQMIAFAAAQVLLAFFGTYWVTGSGKGGGVAAATVGLGKAADIYKQETSKNTKGSELCRSVG